MTLNYISKNTMSSFLQLHTTVTVSEEDFSITGEPAKNFESVLFYHVK